MPAGRPSWKLIQIDIEERVDFQTVRADVDQPNAKPARMVERRKQRVRDAHPPAVAGHVHHIETPVFATVGLVAGYGVSPYCIHYLRRN
jgi:hypothetical protein